jgi:hypothetical protein
MQHIPTLVISHNVTTAVSQYTVVRVNGAYTAGSPILGVALYDAEADTLASVAVQGLLPVQLADSETVTPGELLGVDATGKGVAPDSGDKVSDFSVVISVDNNHALVII